ncbi:hypothetical protein STIAU_5260 [Stigmatella aurantiaca DW4/3-1]|uniref:Uncharacterized protein n=1 Tax=Stigmatella aurantiaca (strain DW4/3-1) TaxID=378806 RepID=Q08NX7_STIAD|nr:hypothetical protein STIAU_5260 [Stigmatella aurantiaca DW4/3-1]
MRHAGLGRGGTGAIAEVPRVCGDRLAAPVQRFEGEGPWAALSDADLKGLVPLSRVLAAWAHVQFELALGQDADTPPPEVLAHLESHGVPARSQRGPPLEQGAGVQLGMPARDRPDPPGDRARLGDSAEACGQAQDFARAHPGAVLLDPFDADAGRQGDPFLAQGRRESILRRKGGWRGGARGGRRGRRLRGALFCGGGASLFRGEREGRCLIAGRGPLGEDEGQQEHPSPCSQKGDARPSVPHEALEPEVVQMAAVPFRVGPVPLVIPSLERGIVEQALGLAIENDGVDQLDRRRAHVPGDEPVRRVEVLRGVAAAVVLEKAALITGAQVVVGGMLVLGHVEGRPAPVGIAGVDRGVVFELVVGVPGGRITAALAVGGQVGPVEVPPSTRVMDLQDLKLGVSVVPGGDTGVIEEGVQVEDLQRAGGEAGALHRVVRPPGKATLATVEPEEWHEAVGDLVLALVVEPVAIGVRAAPPAIVTIGNVSETLGAGRARHGSEQPQRYDDGGPGPMHVSPLRRSAHATRNPARRCAFTFQGTPPAGVSHCVISAQRHVL